MYSPPWTQIGSLQSEVEHLKNALYNKADSYTVSSVTQQLDQLRYKIAALEDQIQNLGYRLEEKADKET